MIPVQQRKRKLSISGPATKETLAKKFKEEIDAEKRKKIRLEWYLKQLLLEKEMLVKENEIEFAKAMQSLTPDEAALAGPPVTATTTTTTATVTSPSKALPTTQPIPITSAPPSMDLPSSLLFGDSSSPSASAYNPFFAVPPPAPLSASPRADTTPSAPASMSHTFADGLEGDDVAPYFAPTLDYEKPSASDEQPSSFFGAEWEQAHCWWADEDELSMVLAVPPSLVV